MRNFRENKTKSCNTKQLVLCEGEPLLTPDDLQVDGAVRRPHCVVGCADIESRHVVAEVGELQSSGLRV